VLPEIDTLRLRFLAEKTVESPVLKFAVSFSSEKKTLFSIGEAIIERIEI